MKTILFISSLLIGLFSNGQTSLTYGQVFNFDVGDVIQGVHNSSQNFNSNPPNYQTNTILSKTITINNDSIIYSTKIDFYSPPACQTCSPSSSTQTLTQIVTNLNSFVPNTNNTTCLPTADTLYYSNCNKRTYEIHPVYGTSCFEPTTETTKYIEGVGVFYDKFIANAPNYAQSYTLNYYMKQSGNCPLGVFINEYKNTFIVSSIFPNPTEGILHLTTTSPVSRFDIFSIDGKIVLSDNIKDNKINISSLAKGTYILNIYSADLKVKTAQIVKE
jgi:hypothetical protein